MTEPTSNKLHLNLGDLAVDTFSTIDQDAAPRGTVRGRNEMSVDVCLGELTVEVHQSCDLCTFRVTCDTCQGPTCYDPTCSPTCGENTCAQTCNFDDPNCTTQTYPTMQHCP